MTLIGKLIKVYWIMLATLYVTEIIKPTKFMSVLLCILAAMLINTREQKK